MHIVCDFDGVIADYVGGVRRAHKLWYGTEIPYPDNWDGLRSERLTSQSDVDAFTDAVPYFWEDLEPIEGALGGIHDLLTRGHQITICTNRADHNRSAGMTWLDRYWPRIGDASVRLPRVEHVAGSKASVPGQIYIDDSPTVLADLADKKPVVYRFVQPWNNPTAGVLNAHGWADLVAQITGVAGPVTTRTELPGQQDILEAIAAVGDGPDAIKASPPAPLYEEGL